MAKPKLNALIVGCGGVTSYMLPALKNSFDLEVTLVDGDTLEKRNLDRQLFRNNQNTRPMRTGLFVPKFWWLSVFVLTWVAHQPKSLSSAPLLALVMTG